MLNKYDRSSDSIHSILLWMMCFLFLMTSFIFFPQDVTSVQEAETDSVIVKVHYMYSVALSVPSNTSYHKLKEEIAQQLDQPASSLRLR